MADTTVDQKPMPRLPFDPEDIPPAVRKRAERVAALYGPDGKINANVLADGSGIQAIVPDATPPSSETPPEQTSPPTEPAPASPQVSAQPPSVTTPTPAEPSPPSPEDDNSKTWKDRAMTYEGRWNNSQKEVASLQDQITQLGNELLHTQRVAQAARVAPPEPEPPPVYLTQEDEKQYGRDLIDFTTRAAAQVVAPAVQELKRENADLQRRLAQESKRAMDIAVAAAVPNYQDIDQNPRWHQWLMGVDLLSGRVRQQLLNEAVTAGATGRVIGFFKGFLAEEVATGHIEPPPQPGLTSQSPPATPAVDLASLVAPGRPRPASGVDATLPPEKPFYTRKNITQNYDMKRRGAFVGRQAEWDRLEQDMIAAGREGRIR